MLRNTMWCKLLALFLLVLPVRAYCADFVIGEGNTAISDISEQIVLRIYEKIGLKVEIVHVPLERQLYMANAGGFDGTGARQAGLEKAFPNLVMVPTPLIASEPMMVFTKDKVFDVKGWESVRPYRIGTIFGFKATGYAPEGLNVDTASTIEQAFQKLDAGRTDIVIAAQTTGLARLAQDWFEKYQDAATAHRNAIPVHLSQQEKQRVVTQTRSGDQGVDRKWRDSRHR